MFIQLHKSLRRQMFLEPLFHLTRNTRHASLFKENHHQVMIILKVKISSLHFFTSCLRIREKSRVKLMTVDFHLFFYHSLFSSSTSYLTIAFVLHDLHPFDLNTTCFLMLHEVYSWVYFIRYVHLEDDGTCHDVSEKCE